jgi:hypothetical protein
MWKSILSDYDAQVAKKLVREILDTVVITQDRSSISLYDNNIGIDLLRGYASNFFDDSNLQQDAVISIQNYFRTNFAKSDYGLMSGYTGLFWLIGHFNNISLCETEYSNLQTIISHIENLAENEEKLRYDVFYGYLGLVICSFELNSTNHNFYDAQLKKLQSICEMDAKFCKWQDLAAKEVYEIPKDSSCYNMGLAHGIPSILVILSKSYCIARNAVYLEIIDKTINWLIEQDSNGVPSFHELVIVGKGKKDNLSHSRLGWCYGDLSVGYSLYMVYKNTNIERYKQIAIGIINRTVGRDFDSANVIDNTICHGTIGIAHMYNRLYQYENNSVFLERALYCVSIPKNSTI